MLLALVADAADFDTDFGCFESLGIGLFAEVVGGAGGDWELGNVTALFAHEVFGLEIVLAGGGAEKVSLLARDVVDDAEFLECGEGSVDADDVHFEPRADHLLVKLVHASGAFDVVESLKNLDSWLSEAEP